jgi:hypothetical protein
MPLVEHRGAQMSLARFLHCHHQSALERIVNTLQLHWHVPHVRQLAFYVEEVLRSCCGSCNTAVKAVRNVFALEIGRKMETHAAHRGVMSWMSLTMLHVNVPAHGQKLTRLSHALPFLLLCDILYLLA